MEKLNNMCVDCPHLEQVCGGTTSQVWTGCILRDQPSDVAKEYIDHMTEAVEGAKK